MTLTRANLEVVLIRRAGKLMTAADLDGTTIAGNNADLNDPIATGLRRSGYTVANVTAVADGDVAGVSLDDLDQVLDLAELRLMENIEGNYDDVDISVTDRHESLSQLLTAIQKKIERLTEKAQRVYGVGQGALSAGVIGLDFMQKDE